MMTPDDDSTGRSRPTLARPVTKERSRVNACRSASTSYQGTGFLCAVSRSSAQENVGIGSQTRGDSDKGKALSYQASGNPLCKDFGPGKFGLFMILETAVGRARVGRDAVRWQGATTLRAPAREAEQRGQRAAARLNRVRSALTQEVSVVMGTNLSVHAASPVEESGQLPFLG